jgi:hypothetical protein
MEAIRYRPRFATEGYVDSAVSTGAQSVIPLATVNKTLNVSVAAGDPVPWDPANATQNITVLASFSPDGKALSLPTKGIYDLDYLSFQGNVGMKYAVTVNGVQVLPVSGAASAGTVLSGRFRTPAANALLRVLNANAAPETLTGTAGDAYLSVSFRSA